MKTLKALAGLLFVAPVVLPLILCGHLSRRRETAAWCASFWRAARNDLRTVCRWNVLCTAWTCFMSVSAWLLIWAGCYGSACACFGSALSAQVLKD